MGSVINISKREKEVIRMTQKKDYTKPEHNELLRPFSKQLVVTQKKDLTDPKNNELISLVHP